MRIPTEHFSNIPVLMLTPQAFSPREEEDEQQTASLPRQFLNRLQVNTSDTRGYLSRQLWRICNYRQDSSNEDRTLVIAVSFQIVVFTISY